MGVNELNSINNQIKPGCCPHGLPAGACPVCSQSGGGTLRQSDRNRNVGEMTYHECAMIGNMMKARALAQKNHEAALKQHTLNIEQFNVVMNKLIQNMKDFSQAMSHNLISKPIAIVFSLILLPIFYVIKFIPNVLRTLNNLRFEITDKLNAIFGEAKAFLDDKLKKIINLLKSPLELFGKIFKKNDSDNNDTKIDDDKKIFNLKTIIHKIKEKFKKKKDNK